MKNNKGTEMKVINKGHVTITKMSYEETGLACPVEMSLLKPIMAQGFDVPSSREIRSLMTNHNMTLEAASAKYKENQEWAT